MRKTTRTTILALAAILFAGCETYKQQVWTPDSFNYTMQRDRTSGEMSDYFGLSWDLKPERK